MRVDTRQGGGLINPQVGLTEVLYEPNVGDITMQVSQKLEQH